MSPDRGLGVAVLGSINMDSVARVRRFPAPGETVIASAFARHAGGKGANQAVAAARAGASVALIGAVGDDPDGRTLVALLRGEGIDCAAVAVVDAPTGVAQILVDAAGENQIVVASGANALVGPAPAIAARVLLAQLETPLAALERFFGCKPAGSTTILNAAPFRPEAAACLALADLVIVNETELSAYVGASLPPGSAEAAALARGLLAHPGQRIVVTLGSAGSVTVDRTGSTLSPGEPARVVDTTGAGDCFCGYLAAGLAAALPLEQALALAHHAAALSVGRPGAAASIPAMTEVRASMPSEGGIR